jgi:YVTN family beta-propeller protein
MRQIELAKHKILQQSAVGNQSIGVALTPDGTSPYESDDRHQGLLYVTNFADNAVSVIDTASNKLATTVPVGNAPIAAAFATVTHSHRGSEQ